MDTESLTEDNVYSDLNIEENVEVDDNIASVLDMEIVENIEVDKNLEPVEGNENVTTSVELSKTNTEKTPKRTVSEKKRLVRLPLARVKHIMKMDPDCHLVSQDTVFLVTKATELFLEYLAQQSEKHTLMTKRKTMAKRDVDAAIDSVPHLCFLDGALE